MSLKAFILGLCCAAACAAPPNDHFQNATVLIGSEAVFVVDTYAATIEPGEPEHPSSALATGAIQETVWYEWTAPGSGMLNLAVERHPQTAMWYASGLYRGSSLANLEPVRRAEGAGTASYLWPVLAGETYSLAIGVQASVTEFFPTTNRLTLILPATHFNFETRPPLETNKNTAFAFGRLSSTNPLNGQLLWWRLPERSESGTERLILYCSSAAEWFVYEGETNLTLVETVEAESAPNAPELSFRRETGRVYSLAFRPASSTRTGVFKIHDFFTTMRLVAEGEPLRSGTNVTLRFEGIPEVGHTNVILSLRAGQPWAIAFWRPPFPASYVVQNIEAGTHEFSLNWQEFNGQRTEWARAQLVVEHANDHFANAQKLEGSAPVVRVDLRGATLEPAEHPSLIQSVWYSWVAQATGRLVVEDWRIDVFNGSSLETLVPTANAPGYSEWEHVYSVVAGEKYYLRGREGDFQMVYEKQIWLIPDSARPANDNFSSAQSLVGTNITMAISALGSTIEANEPINPVTGTVWYRWTSPGRGRVHISKEGIGEVTAYTGSQVGALQPWNGFEALETGRTLYIRYAGLSTRTNDVVLHLNFARSPMNDDYAAATLLGGPSGMVEADFGGASNESNEMPVMGIIPPPAVWYQWKAPESGHLFLRPRLQVRLFRGSVELVPKNETAKIFPVTGGETYHIRFASGAEAALRYEFLQGAVSNDRVEDATVLEGTDLNVAARTFLASRSEDDPTNLLRTVWFRWQAPTNGTVQLSAPYGLGLSFFWHRVAVFDEGRTQEIAGTAVPGTFSFAAQGGSNYLFLVGVYSNSFQFVPPWAVTEAMGSVVDFSLRFTTYHLTSPIEGAVFTTNDVITARISDPVEGIDPPIAGVKFFVPPMGSGPDIGIESTNTFLTLTNRLGNQRVGATVDFGDGRKVDLAKVQFRVIDLGVPHDEFAARELLTGRHVRREITRQEVAAATFEPGETRTNGVDSSLWFKWVAPADGLVSLGPISPGQEWRLIVRAWQGYQAASASVDFTIVTRPPGVIPLPPLPNSAVAHVVQVFEGSALTNLSPIANLVTNVFVAKKGVEYVIRGSPIYNGYLLQFHLITVSVTSPEPDSVTVAGTPVAITLETTEALEEIVSLDVVVGTQKVASFGAPPFQTTVNHLAPGEHPLRSVLTLRSGEIVTNEHAPIRIFPPNVSATKPLLVTTNFAFDVSGFADPVEGRGRINGPPLFYEVRPTQNVAVYTREAALRVFHVGLNGTELSPYAVVYGPNTNSTWQERPVFELASGGVYLLEVSQLFQESGSVKFVPRPINDAIENAITLPATGTNIVLNIKLLRREENEPGSSASAWYRWESPGDGYIRLTKYASVFKEGDLTNAIEYIPEAIPSLVYHVTGGTKYFLGFREQYPDEPTEVVDFKFLSPPENNRIADAKLLRGTDLSVSFNFFAVETEPVEVSLGSTNAIGPIWWKWRSPRNGALRLSVNAGEQSGPPLPGAASIRGRAQLCRLEGTNMVRVPVRRSRYAEWYEVEVNKEYFIAVERVADWPGSGQPNRWELVRMTLHVELLWPPSNDQFANAENIAGDVLVRGRTHFATAEPAEPWHNGFPAAQTVWYRWTASRDSTVYVKYSSGEPNTQALRSFAVYRGTSLHNLSLVRRTPPLQIPWLGARFDAQAGVEYVIVVDGRAGTEDFTLAIETEPLPFEILISQVVDGTIVFDVPKVLNTPITIEYSSDLKWWMNYYTYPPNHPGPFSFPVDDLQEHVFYRVVAGFGHLSDVGMP